MTKKRGNTSTDLLSTDQLDPNDYNPNRMSEAEFAELVAEIRHLGRLPKPIVVRAADNGRFLIVDGEHNWRAAKEANLNQVSCEIIEADDFEAMRQTYKRNQHGTHDKVLLAKMFKRMGHERGLSLRKLAQEIEVSEGTIRNTIEYLRAVRLRNSYALSKDAESEIAALSLRQVRLYNRLSKTLGNMWLDGGADVKALFRHYEKTKRYAEKLSRWCGTEEEYLKETTDYFEKSGLLQYVKPVRTPEQFAKALERVKEWAEWEQEYFWHILGGEWYSREEFRKYAHYYYEGIWPFDNRPLWMEAALSMIIKHDGRQARFRITPEQFDAVIKQVGEYSHEKGGVHIDIFQDYFKAAILETTGEKIESTLSADVRERCMQAEIDHEAPDYIRESNLEIVTTKYALWKVLEELEGESEENKARIEQIVRELAKERYIERDRSCVMGEGDRKLKLSYGQDVKLTQEKWAVWSAIREKLAAIKANEHEDTAGGIELAMEVADCLYDRAKFPDYHQKLSLILAQLRKCELKWFYEEFAYNQKIKKIKAAFDAIHSEVA